MAHDGIASSDAGALLAMRTGAGQSAPAPPAVRGAVPIIVFHGDADATIQRSSSSGVIHRFLDSRAAHRHAAGAGVAMVAEAGGRRRAFTRHAHRARAGGILAGQWTAHGAGHP